MLQDLNQELSTTNRFTKRNLTEKDLNYAGKRREEEKQKLLEDFGVGHTGKTGGVQKKKLGEVKTRNTTFGNVFEKSGSKESVASVKENDGSKNAGNGHGVLMKGAQIHLFPQKRDSVGIRALWVHKSFRRMGISHNLLENCRRRFYRDASMISSSTIVEKVKVAFSQPTYQGKLFIAKYADNDGKFLVYE